jgi:hypothetical protein
VWRETEQWSVVVLLEMEEGVCITRERNKAGAPYGPRNPGRAQVMAVQAYHPRAASGGVLQSGYAPPAGNNNISWLPQQNTHLRPRQYVKINLYTVPSHKKPVETVQLKL